LSLAAVSLSDKYELESGRIYINGVQALVRLPIVQRIRDRAAGLNTAACISGYRGSPLGTYDTALMAAQKFLERQHIVFQPGVNEDMAATALWGSQQVNLFPGAKYDGVFGIWYGKGPGVDRSGDVFKHANAAGTSKHGGVLAIAGDDHGSHSSTMPHQSEQMMAGAMLPVLNPGPLQDFLDFGLLGFALSRFSGCWVGMKTCSQTVETSGSIDTDAHRLVINIPSDFPMPPGGLNIRYPDPPLEQEARLHTHKMSAVAAFARANAIDRVVIETARPRLGIATTGKSYLDVREALRELGISDRDAADLGIRLYKIGMVWPLEPTGAMAFARGLDEILVVEEKRGFVEEQLAKALFNMPGTARPRLVGKLDENGAALVPSNGELTPTQVAKILVGRIARVHGELPALRQRLERLERLTQRVAATKPVVVRPPYFCSGCPHNTSTQVPEGSRALAGIGCHGMIVFSPERRTNLWSHMGGEGAAWIGQAPFTTQEHIFQNLGDGTYFHSGLMAIRAAAASGANITYKLLYNDAVAMTGGQAVEGQLNVPQITRQVAAEGAKKIVVITDEPGKYPAGTDFAPGVEIRHRDMLDAVQRELREVKGLTVLIYDQTCAAEKRRRRKRGTFADPPKRMFINEAVCEGCGDCSAKSNCVSVEPVETPLGRKRRINQSTCNKDYSCANGFCPSFVTVHGGDLVKAAGGAAVRVSDPAAGLPLPAPMALERPYGIVVTGIGGTGVVTIGALLGMAAHLEGKGCSVLDSMGMAQKNGAVMSHIRLAPTPDDLHSSRIAAGAAGLLLACDMVVAVSTGAITTLEPGVTRAVVNSAVTPTAAFVTNNNVDFREAEMRASLVEAAGPGNVDFIDATGAATRLLGDSIATNLFIVGYAFQKGWIPLGLDAIMRAIELNRVAVEQNKLTFAWGRRAAVDWSAIDKAAPPPADDNKTVDLNSLGAIVTHRAGLLADYQDKAYADSYRAFVAEVEAAERQRAPGRNGLAMAVARNLFKLMAYKDEYEVARLYSDGQFRKRLAAQFQGDYKLELNLAPPLFARHDPVSGELKKSAYGPWIFPVLAVLARFKGLRGTALDPFGYLAERRAERRMIAEYRESTRSLLGQLNVENHATAVELASVPDQIRGFGHVKARNMARAKETEAALKKRFAQAGNMANAAE
jgi:indolepyruvate ferredoxin oxidoreductase